LAYQTGTGSGVRGCSLEISETLLDFRAPLKILSSDSPRSALAALAKKSENRDN